MGGSWCAFTDDSRLACGSALEERVECVNERTCETFQEWLEQEPAGAYPCVETDQTTDLACG